MKVRVKIKKRWYNGEVLSKGDELYLIRYNSPETGRTTSGWFNRKYIDFKSYTDDEKMELTKRNMVKIECNACGYTTVSDKKEKYGYCPECMQVYFVEVRDVGFF